MTRRLSLAIAAALVALPLQLVAHPGHDHQVLGTVTTVFAHPGHTHKILGTVTAVTAASVEVLDRGNEKTTFAVTKDTKIRVGKGAGTINDVRTGLRIVVEAEEEEDETFVALTIQLPERPAQEEAR